MELQFYGANCIILSQKTTRIVVDDNLSKLGKKNVAKAGDVVLKTSELASDNLKADTKIVIDCPGEYEVDDISIVGIPVRLNTDDESKPSGTMFKITTNDIDILITGHIYPALSDQQLEAIGMCDVLVIPVGGNGYTTDAKGVLNVIKELEPKIVIPTHYLIKDINYPVPQATIEEAVKELGMEIKDKLGKLKLKSTDLTDVTQLIQLEVS